MHIQSPRLQTRSISSHSSRPRTCDQIPTCNADSKIVQRPAVSDVDIINYPYTMIPSRRGGHLLMLNNYTFKYNEHSKRYYCSQSNNTKTPVKCKSSVKLDKVTGLIVSLREEHNHPPPRYMLTADGQYIKY
ncbi:uncharacterized protein LOC125242337 isoform X1 [Leguminivora glycinivorella]|uniref:uncharacterized protein LOC125242337 isoform X1 n=1 Tax=Leguminivora glycinivorella TaxID=1035111 RepID=UPI0020104E04|nr:uncharacterized protein LOC125242337 isoform X1 [Leguminivora glycinivorella]